VLVRVGQEVQALPRRLTGRWWRRAPAGALVALGLLAGCGSSAAPAPGGCPTCAATLAQVRADTVAGVAARIYRQEVSGPPNGAAYVAIAGLPGLTRGLQTGDFALARRALEHQPVRHAVRARVVRGGRVLVDVGLPFVIAGTPRPELAPDGRLLGRIEVSIQDVIGFVRLVERLTGAQVVVRGTRDHHVATSLPAALSVTLPTKGPVRVGRRRFTVSFLRGLGFGGEPLSVWVLAP
jgi:hypothetical protein